MNLQTFWELFSNGGLEKLAKEDPLSLEIAYEKLTEELIQIAENQTALRNYSNKLTMRLLREAPTFTQRAKLATEQPEVFERQRARLLRAHIELLEDERRITTATRLQWRIDMERKKYKNPLGACIALSNMMCDKVWGAGGLQDALNGCIIPKKNSAQASRSHIIPFKKPPGDPCS